MREGVRSEEDDEEKKRRNRNSSRWTSLYAPQDKRPGKTAEVVTRNLKFRQAR
jgi:hypothetical protein